MIPFRKEKKGIIRNNVPESNISSNSEFEQISSETQQMPTYGLRLRLGLRNVLLGEGTSGVRVSILTSNDSQSFIEIAQTESQFHQRHVEFDQRISLAYRFDKLQRIKFVVHTVCDATSERLAYKIGETLCDLPVLLSNQGKLALPINNDPYAQTLLDVSLEVPSLYSDCLRLGFSAKHLHNPSVCPSIAPYFVLLLVMEERTIMLYRSETLSSKSPEWDSFTVPLYILQFHQQAEIQLHVYNYFPNHKDVLSGMFSTNLLQLNQGPSGPNTYMLMNHEGRKKDENMYVELTLFEKVSGTSFFDLITNNTHIHMGVAIDLTASNGDPTKPDSLHYIHPHQPNSYITQLLRLLPPFLGYSRDPRITALGFGAKIHGRPDVSHCFPLDSTSADSYVHGMEGVLNAYRRSRIEVLPFAPTELADVIYHMSKFAKASSRINMGLYFVLLILTDGDITKETRTADALVDASEAPLSVIVIGLRNDTEFAKLKSLESPVLKHSDGRSTKRQVLSFVRSDRLSDDDAISLLPFRIQQWNMISGQKK